ncbi:formyl transferase [Bacteroidales bacterium OttesenSCG-928-C19]|nr:formyl transferase [Bacteroidales bacterium OttesenSCG-928-C19]
MVVRILGNRGTSAYKQAQNTVLKLGHQIDDGSYFVCDVAIAPLLTERLSDGDIYDPIHGTLIFHPSPLPYGRGASAIKHAYSNAEPITAATWFWANSGKMDSGDICEMEVVTIDYGLKPREFYEAHIIPALCRTLERALVGIGKGNIRRVPQVEQYATFKPKL